MIYNREPKNTPDELDAELVDQFRDRCESLRNTMNEIEISDENIDLVYPERNDKLLKLCALIEAPAKEVLVLIDIIRRTIENPDVRITEISND